MNTDIRKSILRSILVNKKVGTKIDSKKYNKLQIWKDELTPLLEKLQEMGYIKGYWKKLNVTLEIIKPISLKTITNL